MAHTVGEFAQLAVAQRREARFVLEEARPVLGMHHGLQRFRAESGEVVIRQTERRALRTIDVDVAHLRDIEHIQHARHHFGGALCESPRRFELAARFVQVGDVPRHRIDERSIGRGGAAPFEPAPLAGSGSAAIAELHHGRARRQLLHDGYRRRDILWMNEVQIRAAQQLCARPSERALPGGIELFEVPIETDDAQQVRRQAEEPVGLCGGAAMSIRSVGHRSILEITSRSMPRAGPLQRGEVPARHRSRTARCIIAPP